MTIQQAAIAALTAKRLVCLERVVAGISKMAGPAGKDGVDGKDGAKGTAGIRGAAGEQGPKGDAGPMPDHKWEGTKLRFQKPDGKWGTAVDLKGDPGEAGRGRIVAVGGGGRSGIGSLTPGAANVEPAGIAVQQGGQWVNLPWQSFITVISGAVDMAATFSRRSDFVGDTVLYRGESAPGSLESAPVWRIKKVEFVAGLDGKTDINERWAGNAAFDQVWDDRATLIYS